MIIVQCSYFLVPLPCLLEWFHHSKGEIPGYSCLPTAWSQQCCMPFGRLGLPCSMVCSVSSDCLVHIQIIPIMPDSSVHYNYSELIISSRPTHWAISNQYSFQVAMLFQYLNNVSKIDLYTSSPTSVRKIAGLLFATTCLAVALPSKWKAARGQSLLQILQYELNHISALRRVEKLHQRVRKHSTTYPYVIAWLQKKHARKWFFATNTTKWWATTLSAWWCADH